MGLGLVWGRCGDIDQAKSFIQDGLRLARQRGQSWTISRLLNEWGDISLDYQKTTLANEAFQESLEIARATRAHGQIGEALFGLARVNACNGRHAEADQLVEESLSIMESIKHPRTNEVKQWRMRHKFWQSDTKIRK